MMRILRDTSYPYRYYLYVQCFRKTAELFFTCSKCRTPSHVGKLSPESVVRRWLARGLVVVVAVVVVARRTERIILLYIIIMILIKLGQQPCWTGAIPPVDRRGSSNGGQMKWRVVVHRNDEEPRGVLRCLFPTRALIQIRIMIAIIFSFLLLLSMPRSRVWNIRRVIHNYTVLSKAAFHSRAAAVQWGRQLYDDVCT